MKTRMDFNYWGPIAILLLALGLVIPGQATASTHDDLPDTIIVFGDSLSDTGNSLIASSQTSPVPVPFPSHYNEGRFSNGPVWVDYLAGRLSPPAPADGFALAPSIGIVAGSGGATTCPLSGLSCSYAFGGSGTQDAQTPTGIVPGLLTQVGLFAGELRGFAADPETLYVVWSGANNYLFPAFNAIFGPLAGGSIFGPILPPDSPSDAVADIRAAIENLTALGARKFLVVNLPDLGDAPLTAPELAAFVDPDVRDTLRSQSLIHNRKLARAVRRLNRRGDSIGRDIELLDAFTLFKLKLFRPGRKDAGPASGCLLPPLFPNPPCDPTMPPDFDQDLRTRLWDEQHPTTELHKILSRRAFRVLGSFSDSHDDDDDDDDD